MLAHLSQRHTDDFLKSPLERQKQCQPNLIEIILVLRDLKFVQIASYRLKSVLSKSTRPISTKLGIKQSMVHKKSVPELDNFHKT